jgi:hypothetical protein
MKPDKISLFLASLVILTAISWITSCTHDADISSMPEICFKRDVQLIIGTNCAISGCHDGTGEAMPLTTYTEIRNEVEPGNPDKSPLYQAIIATWGENKMPPDQPLTQENRTIIRVWIEQGAAEVKCDAVSVANGINEVSVNPN